jgi:hypothetical protein
MPKKCSEPEFNYWLPEEDEKVSYAFSDHVRLTAQSTGRPYHKPDFFKKDQFGRIPWKQLDACVKKSNTDHSFTYDCAQRISMVLLQQIGAMINSAPTLDDGLNLLVATISYFDDRMLAFKQIAGNKTIYGMFYRKRVDERFYHTQAGALLLTCLDAWPHHYIDNSTCNFPSASKREKTTLRSVLGAYPWVTIETEKLPVISWTVETEKLLWPAPNFNRDWWEHTQKFLRWGLDALSEAEPFRKPWCRLATSSMMANPRNLTLDNAMFTTGVSSKTLSSKLAKEGHTASELKAWIIKECTTRAMAASLPEEWIADQFGYTRTELRATLKRRGIENPYLAPVQMKEATRKALQIPSKIYNRITTESARLRTVA